MGGLLKMMMVDHLGGPKKAILWWRDMWTAPNESSIECVEFLINVTFVQPVFCDNTYMWWYLVRARYIQTSPERWEAISNINVTNLHAYTACARPQLSFRYFLHKISSNMTAFIMYQIFVTFARIIWIFCRSPVGRRRGSSRLEQPPTQPPQTLKPYIRLT